MCGSLTATTQTQGKTEAVAHSVQWNHLWVDKDPASNLQSGTSKLPFFFTPTFTSACNDIFPGQI